MPLGKKAAKEARDAAKKGKPADIARQAMGMSKEAFKAMNSESIIVPGGAATLKKARKNKGTPPKPGDFKRKKGK